jgi:hypothetical protein
VSGPLIDHCAQCEGTGYLLDQSYGLIDVPNGWRTVQACDECQRWDGDQTAAREACHQVEGNAYAYFPAHDPTEPGDWAIYAPDLEDV